MIGPISDAAARIDDLAVGALVPVRRSAISVLLASAAILLGCALAPGPAAVADSGYIKVVGNATSPADNPGLLSIGLTASSTITSVTVQVTFGATSYTVPAPLQLTGGTNTNGTWAVQTPITTADLPLGQYYVYVTATDTGGDSISDAQVSQWNFNIQPTITLTATPDQISADGQTITLSGTATGVYPGISAAEPGPQSEPMSGQQVTIGTTGEYFAADPSSVTTESDGTFKAAVQTGMSSAEGTDTWVAGISQTTTTAQASSPTVTIEPVEAPVQVMASITPADPIWGQPVYLTGTVTVDSGGTWQPLSNATVEISNSGGPLFTNTGSRGDFSFSLEFAAGLDAGSWQVEASGGEADPFAGTATITVPSNGPFYDAALTGFTAKINKYGIVGVTGCLDNTTTPAVGVPAGTTVDIQYSAGASGPWKTLGSVATTGSTCGTNSAGGSFTGSVPAVLTSAYYRAALTSDQKVFLPTITSNAVPSAIIDTRFVSFAATPHTVRRDGKITISGRLELAGRSWRGYAGQSVDIIFRPRGSKYWYAVYWVRTNSTGRFSKTFTDKFGTATWSADYNGNSTHLVAGAATVRIRVT